MLIHEAVDMGWGACNLSDNDLFCYEHQSYTCAWERGYDDWDSIATEPEVPVWEVAA